MKSKLPNIFFHGSRVKGINELKISNEIHDSAHRDAAYLTESLEVASCYGKEIYIIKLFGDPDLALNTNVSMSKNMRARVINAMLSIDPDICINKLDTMRSGDAIFDFVTSHLKFELEIKDTSLINYALLNQGIWMIYGVMHPMAVNGVMDRGIQYALLDISKSQILSHSNYIDIWNNASIIDREKWKV